MTNNVIIIKKQMSAKLFFNIFRKKESYAQMKVLLNEDFPNKAEAVGANLSICFCSAFL